MIPEREREALMRLTMCARRECRICMYQKRCDFDFRCELATKNMNILADALRAEQTEQSDDWICATCKHIGDNTDECRECGDGGHYEYKPKQTEPQRDCDNLINAVVKLDMSREDKFKVIELLEQHCEKCKHYLFTDIDGHYCEHETYGQPCEYEPKDEPQTMYYPQVDGITPSVIEPQFDKDMNVRSKYKQGTWLYGDGVYCSCCGYKLETTALLAKCPKCGADMSKTDCAWK